MKVHNFNSGPSILPNEVLYKASKAVIDLDGNGMSILEISHRSDQFRKILDETRASVKQLLQLEDDFEVLLLHGGASSQFMQVPYNLLDRNMPAAYADTGIWSSKAIKEARFFGPVDVVCSSKEVHYSQIPKKFNIPAKSRYFHITTNNTIYGTQWHKFPETKVPVIADMSSDIFSRKLNFNKFSLIYAGAQKNLGPAGVTLVVVRKSILGKISRKIPSMMDYQVHIENGSLFNTPPVFAIYISMLTLRWLKQQGGIAAIEKVNQKKSDLLYQEIDTNPLFRGTVAREDRSRMNVCFVIQEPALENEFLEFCRNEDIAGIKGHRTTGGFRVSLYNAMPLDSVEFLVESMRFFANKKG